MVRKVKALQMDDFIFKPSLTAQTKTNTPSRKVVDKQSIKTASEIVFKQMQNEGLRQKTLVSYKKALRLFVEYTNVEYIEDINRDNLLDWVHSNGVQPNTKKNRLRFMSSILGHFYENGWIEEKFWKDIKIKTPNKQQMIAKENELEVLLSLLDLSKYIHFRDCCVLLLLVRTGIRINTLVELREHMIDFHNKELALEGSIMKNGRNLRLPLDDEMLELLSILIKKNREVKKRYKQKNDFVFITKNGKSCQSNNHNNNSISKRLHYYSKKYNLKTISPHKIRRMYATSLMKRGASIAVISKALGHSSLSVTERYIGLSEQEVSNELRKYM